MGEGAVCVEMVTDVCIGKENISELKIDNKFLVEKPALSSGLEPEQEQFPNKRVAKEASVEDVKSEVVNPTISPRGSGNGLSNFQDISSQPTELAISSEETNVRVGSGELTSGCLGSSSSAETVSEEVQRVNEHGTSHDDAVQDNRYETDSMSRVVLEVPEHVSTSSGIRKITFKFSKRKEEYCTQSAALVHDSINSRDYDNWCDPIKEVSGSENAINYPTNVKKLLSTGILDGARVKYISHNSKKELDGVVNIGGYLCGCSSCNFSKVLSAYEFELHAGARTRHPNNHIFLENGNPIYSIIQELKTTPVSRLDEVIREVAGSSINEAFFNVWKASLEHKSGMFGAELNYYSKLSCLPHSCVSYPSKVLEESFSPTASSFLSDYPFTQQTNMEIVARRALKRPSSCISSSVSKQKKTLESNTRRRDNDLHRLLFLPNGLPDGAELAYYVKGQKILGGYKQGNGIVCNCCREEISPSQFEAHAGMAARRQPYRHIYASNGLTLHDIATSLASGRSVTTGVKDDMCAKCGDAGSLIPCESCPRAFHLACLGLDDMPEGVFNCPDCDKSVHGDEFSKPITIRLTQAIKTPEYVAGGCVICRADDYTCRGFDDRTVIICEQCEKEFHIGCLRETGVCDLKEIPKEDWFCCDDCSRIRVELKNNIYCGVQVIPTPDLDVINRKLTERGLLAGGRTVNVQWRILLGRSRERDEILMLSRAAAIFREVFAPIVAATGRDLIPVMVYGRNISGQEFGGMCCVILIVNNVVVSAGLLRIFGREVAELPLVATSRRHQGKGYFQALFSCIERMLSSLKVESLVLPAADEAEPIWTNRFGFSKMDGERMAKYMKQFRLTVFNGSSMLEKAVTQMNN